MGQILHGSARTTEAVRRANLVAISHLRAKKGVGRCSTRQISELKAKRQLPSASFLAMGICCNTAWKREKLLPATSYGQYFELFCQGRMMVD